MRIKLLVVVGAMATLEMLEGCTTAPMKPLPPQVVAAAPTAFVVMADGAVGLAVSKGAKPSDIATIAYQLEQFATSGKVVTVQALTTEIQVLETQANLNVVEVAAIAQLRMAFDTIIAGYISNGVISGQAQTVVTEILQDVVLAAELLGAPDPAQTTVVAPPTAEIGPPVPTSSGSAMRALESPTVIGGATSTVIVASLQAFKHISISAPTAAAITVLATFLAAWLATH